MKKAKIMLSWMLHPPVWVLCTIPTVVFAALIFVFATGKTESALAYPVYLMSAYSLVILLAVAPRLTNRVKAAILDSAVMQRAVSTPLLGRYLTDTTFRGSISIYQGMTVNFFYVVFRIYAGIRYVSVAVNNAASTIDLLHMTYAQQSIIGSGGYMPEDVWDVQNIMSSGKWDLERIITHEFPLDELEAAIRMASDVEHAGNVIIKMC